MDVIDYGRSFIGSKWPKNTVRFWVESRTRLVDERADTSEDYCQCGSCKSEDTFAERDLFHEDNYDFLPIFGPAHGVVFRRTAYLNEGYREVRPADQWWGGQVYMLRRPRSVRLLGSPAAIREAAYAGLPIVAQTEIRNADTRLRAIIECPVKTLNLREEGDLYQVDTGPLALPDLATRHERPADGIRLAYVAFNGPHFADFVIEAPTPIVENGQPVATIHHYSKRLSLPAENRLYAVEA